MVFRENDRDVAIISKSRTEENSQAKDSVRTKGGYDFI